MQKTCEEEAHIWQKARPGSHSQSLQSAQYHLTFGWCSLYSKGSFGGSRLPGCRNQPNSHDFTANTWSEKRRYAPLEMAALGDSQSKRLGREGQRKRDAKKNKNREKQEWKEGEKTKRKRKKGGWSEEGKKIGRVRQQNTGKTKTNKRPLPQSALDPDSPVPLVSNMTFVPVCHFAFAWHQWPTQTT